MNQMIVSLLNTLGLKSDPQTSVVFRNTVRAIVQPQLDAVLPVPFAFSALFQVGSSLSDVGGMGEMLDFEATITIANLAEGEFDGFTVYIDTQRGSYWGDISISVVASDEDVFTSDVKLNTLDGTQCNSLVSVSIDGDAVAEDETYTLAITASGGGHSITRTFTLNVIANPEE
jgi:hypothetical protein